MLLDRDANPDYDKEPEHERVTSQEKGARRRRANVAEQEFEHVRVLGG